MHIIQSRTGRVQFTPLWVLPSAPCLASATLCLALGGLCHFTTPSTLTVQADLAERVKGRVRQQLSRSQRKTQTLKGPKLLRKLPPNSKKKAKLPCCWSLCGGRRMGLKHMCKVGSQGTEGDQKPPSRCSCLSFKGRNSF